MEQFYAYSHRKSMHKDLAREREAFEERQAAHAGEDGDGSILKTLPTPFVFEATTQRAEERAAWRAEHGIEEPQASEEATDRGATYIAIQENKAKSREIAQEVSPIRDDVGGPGRWWRRRLSSLGSAGCVCECLFF